MSGWPALTRSCHVRMACLRERLVSGVRICLQSLVALHGKLQSATKGVQIIFQGVQQGVLVGNCVRRMMDVPVGDVFSQRCLEPQQKRRDGSTK
eukprot:1156812-Pelagomonas_calceolata.AAC.2